MGFWYFNCYSLSNYCISNYHRKSQPDNKKLNVFKLVLNLPTEVELFILAGNSLKVFIPIYKGPFFQKCLWTGYSKSPRFLVLWVCCWRYACIRCWFDLKNIASSKIYNDESVNILSCSNNGLHESLLLAPAIRRIALFCILNTLINCSRGTPEHDSIFHMTVEIWVVYGSNCCWFHYRHGSYYKAGCS